ncbi:MAG: hypothetical protein HY924_11960 [Elusimicrobia bacterium]|nr:hypothetical protein [Elusimicrobiota bacterium]
MNPKNITFENMTEKLLEAIPELRASHDRVLALVEPDGVWSGQHIAYEEVVSKTIKELLLREKPDERLLRKIFDFVEMLASHPEEHVQEVIHNSVCEPICSDELTLQRARNYMGPATKEFCKSIVTWEPPKK